MKFSIITACNSDRYLMDLYKSIKSQSYENWEWVIYLNKLSTTVIEILCSEFTDPRVRFVIDKSNSNKIGEIKNLAFNKGTGDILCEVDQDDMLLPNCLKCLYEVYSKHPEVGFVYSDDVILDDSHKHDFAPYNKLYGWKYEPVLLENDRLGTWIKSFDPSPSSFSSIHSQPDHIRTWRKSVYDSIGGHDCTLQILDDQDLLSRTYLATECYHIRKPLYIYRYHDNNTYKNYINLINELGPKLQLKYLPRLIKHHAHKCGLPCIDLGGGINKTEGFISVDKLNSDVIADLDSNVWPFEDNSVGYIRASHILEHLKDPLNSMKELYRILCDGGYVYIEVPSTDGRGAFQDPTHKSYWNSNSFWYYTRESHNKFIRHYGYDIKFRQIYLDNINWNDNIIITRAWLQAVKSDKYEFGLYDIKGR